ncbi:MAG: hypothetical protein EXS36_01135 [Pedosphaera sp.]|nr:hypothetical protein [Pedosphaera sp.]
MPEANLFLLFTNRLNTLGVRYMVSGSVAVIIYGEPRLTHDVDLIVVLDREQIARLPEVFPLAEFYCPPTEVVAVEAAREQRGHFNIIHHETGFKADVYLSGRDPLHAWGLARARRLEVEGEPLVVAPPEYVILRKLEYYREGGSEKHLRDIRSMLNISPEAIQRAELEQQIAGRGLEEAWRQVQASRE